MLVLIGLIANSQNRDDVYGLLAKSKDLNFMTENSVKLINRKHSWFTEKK